MACIDPRIIRNIGVIAHIDAGKTTLSERILYYSRRIHRLGEVHDGAATMDFMPEEQERGITITSACTTCKWRDCRINLVDTPGHVDFTIEVERCLRVLDGAVGVFCAVGGVESQSETVWRQSQKFGVPKLAFINKMDRQGADFFSVLAEMADRLDANPVACNIPKGEGSAFTGIIDLVELQLLSFCEEDLGVTVERQDLSAADRELAETWREKLLEKLAEADEEFLDKWYAGEYSVADIHKAMRRAVCAGAITPVFCGSALRNMGVQPLLDAICEYLPSPCDVHTKALLPDGTPVALSANTDAEPVALVFKIVMDANRKNCFARVYSGSIANGDTLYNPRQDKQERVARIYRIHASQREQTDDICAGDIAVLGGLQSAGTGDTYCLKKHPLLLEPVRTYQPVITLALEPQNSAEGKNLDEALFRYQEEDPTLHYELDEESGARTVSGMGELHLEVVLERLQREYKISPRTGQPQAALRETITAAGHARVVFDRELGKERHQGEVEISVTPLPRDSGVRTGFGPFMPEDASEARKLYPPAIVQAVQEGIQDGLQNGPSSGWPLVDVDVRIDGIFRTEGLSTIAGMRMAASQALRDALSAGGPRILEPIMNVEINTPEEFLGSVISLFTQSGGKVEDVEDAAGIRRLRGSAPLKKLFGFSTKLRSSSQGKAGFATTFRAYDLA